MHFLHKMMPVFCFTKLNKTASNNILDGDGCEISDGWMVFGLKRTLFKRLFLLPVFERFCRRHTGVSSQLPAMSKCLILF